MKNFLFSIFLTCFFVGYGQSDFSTRSTQELLAKVNSLGHQTGDINQFFSKAELSQLQSYYQTQGKMNVTFGGSDFSIDGGASMGYGVETQADGFMSFDPVTGGGITSISGGSGTTGFEGAGAISNDDPNTGYAIDTNGVLYSIDVATGVYTNEGNVGILNMNGMEFNPVNGTLYAITGTDLYTIDVDAPSATLVGSLGISGTPLAIALAIDGDGNAYTYDIQDDTLYSINLATGAATLIGSIGFDGNFGQGMAWDSSTDTVYMAAFNNSTFMSEWRSVNTSTGMTTLIGNMVGTGALTQVAWVSVVGESTNPPVGNCDLEGELADPTLGGEVWTRPFEDGSGTSPTGTGVSYHVYGPFTVDTAGSYEFNSTQSFDGFIFVYETAFDPMDPLTNYLAGDDDFGTTGLSQIITNLNTGTEYFLITTSFSPSDFGTFTNTITGPGTVTCGTVDPPADGCLDAENGQYPTTTFVPACNGVPQGTTGGLAWTGEYTMVQVTNGTEYIFSLSDASYFVTIGDSTGTTVLASGTGSVTWTSNLSGTVRFYAHFDSDCNWDAETFLERFVQCGDIPPPPSDCDDQTVPSNNLENGLFFGGDTDQSLAVDIIVGDTGFPVYGVDLNVFTDGNTDLTFNVTFYEDAGGLPGTEHATTTTSVFSSDLVGNAFGFDVYNYVVAFDTTVNLEANTTYWMQVESDGLAWDATSSTILGSGLVFSNTNTAGVWTVDPVTELVYTLVCEELGVSDMNAFDFAYYPNPVKDVLNISAKKNISNVSVNNMAGQQVINKVNVNNGQVDVSSLAPGVYVFRVTLEGGQVETFKIIKK